MGRASLESVDLKLGRAKDHFYSVTEEIHKFQTDPESYRLTLERQPNRGGVCKVTDVQMPPIKLGLLIGECVHQYRSALDHLLFQLVLANCRGRPSARAERRAEFPIFDSGPKFRGKRKRKGVPSTGSGRAKIQDIAPSAQAVIERLQPYHRRKNPRALSLRQLQELSNIDKHRLLHVTYSAFRGSTFDFQTRNVRAIDGFHFKAGALKRNAVIAAWQVVPIDPRLGTDVQMKAEILTDITFSKTSPARSVRGKSVAKTLYDIGAFIASDVLPPLCDALGLSSQFKPGKLIDVEAIPVEERDAVAEQVRIENLKA